MRVEPSGERERDRTMRGRARRIRRDGGRGVVGSTFGRGSLEEGVWSRLGRSEIM